MLKCAIFADFLDFDVVADTLTQLHAREDKIHAFLAFMFKNINHFIYLNASLSCIRFILVEKLC